MQEPREIGERMLSIVRPHISERSYRSSRSDLECGEPCESIRTSLAAAAYHDVALPRDLVEAARFWCIEKRGVHRRLIGPTTELLDRIHVTGTSAA